MVYHTRVVALRDRPTATGSRQARLIVDVHWRLRVLRWRLRVLRWRLRVLCWRLRVLCWRLRVLCWRLRSATWRLPASEDGGPPTRMALHPSREVAFLAGRTEPRRPETPGLLLRTALVVPRWRLGGQRSASVALCGASYPRGWRFLALSERHVRELIAPVRVGRRHSPLGRRHRLLPMASRRAHGGDHLARRRHLEAQKRHHRKDRAFSQSWRRLDARRRRHFMRHWRHSPT